VDSIEHLHKTQLHNENAHMKPETPQSFLHSPPDSNGAAKTDESDMEVSEISHLMGDDQDNCRDRHHERSAHKDAAVVNPEAATTTGDYHNNAVMEDQIPPSDITQDVEMGDVKTEDNQATADDSAVEEDIGQILPDHYSGTVPVFMPTMRQFRDFKKFVS